MGFKLLVMGKIILNIIVLFFLGNINIYSQIIKLNEYDKYKLEQIDNSSYYLLKINFKNDCYLYKIKIKQNPKEGSKIYTFIGFKNLPKVKGKMFSPFDGLRYGTGYFLIENKYYKNIGASIP